MTPHPQRKYIITEKQIAIIEKGGWIDAFIVLDDVRSHPHNSPSAAPLNLIDYCDNDICVHKSSSSCIPNKCNYLKSVDVQKRIKRDADLISTIRNETLDYAVEAADQIAIIYGFGECARIDLSKAIESLRTQAPRSNHERQAQ